MLRNTGARAGKHVTQVYLSRTESSVDRPPFWLAAFHTAHLAAGETAAVCIKIPRRVLRHWATGWHTETGVFDVSIGTSSEHREHIGRIVVD